MSTVTVFIKRVRGAPSWARCQCGWESPPSTDLNAVRDAIREHCATSDCTVPDTFDARIVEPPPHKD